MPEPRAGKGGPLLKIRFVKHFVQHFALRAHRCLATVICRERPPTKPILSEQNLNETFFLFKILRRLHGGVRINLE